jgi:uncharacterized protein
MPDYKSIQGCDDHFADQHISDTNIHPLAKSFTDWVNDPSFPCVGAKSALAKSQICFVIGRDFASAWDDLSLHQSLVEFAKHYGENKALFQSLVILYEKGIPNDEISFEQQMWDHINSLTKKDTWLGQPADNRVSSDPDDPHFSLSFGGEAFFVVGLHPKASRLARRFIAPAMVFNLHDQFEQLREQQRYDKLREAILSRDEKLAGSRNPMLARHGSVSEARQYSGRVVANDWQCPFAGRKEPKKNGRNSAF